jgi:hypothetical protein
MRNENPIFTLWVRVGYAVKIFSALALIFYIQFYL